MESPPPCKPKTEHVTFHRGDGTLQVGSIREEALTPSCHNTPQNSERTSGAMERYVHGFDLAPELTPYCHNTHRKTVSITSVAMEELSRQGQKASTHSRSLR